MLQIERISLSSKTLEERQLKKKAKNKKTSISPRPKQKNVF